MNSATVGTSISQTPILGIPVRRTTYEECTELILQKARIHQSFTVAEVNVHSLMSGYLSPKGHGYYLNHFSLVLPDGQPIRWALNLFRKSGEKRLIDRVRGPELMLRLCQKAADEGISIFLYGSTPLVLEKLQNNLTNKFPNLTIAGAISPPFRPLTLAEDTAYIQQIRQSGAGLVFVALGCPRQEQWAFLHRNSLDCPMICVGAAFDMHAGIIPEAPLFLQRLGLEWLYRFCQEPTRLWKRYLLFNPLFLILLALQFIKILPLRNYNHVVSL
ncbi:MAG TPA: glycosyltransferase [Cyanobacteria bacterium UBA11162]|nr:glycosyltransferase [Cyanobacteria bacterium UBA12227]HAX88648.1 glycosyltransferase [Cyanobacteria bacterium UBA11370]HBL10619.1 glycosyltransferase [Cyanobacteria bacterium UBA11162]HBY81067.1 glycosyltransferase [Cyanobacteria bacterium UBA11148]